MMDKSGWVQEGARLGARYAGIWVALPLLLSFLWLLLSFAGAIVAVATGAYSNPERTLPNLFIGVISLLLYAGFYLCIGGIIGVFPATLIGAATGALLGAVLRLPHIAPYRWNRLAVGGGVALLIVLLVNSPFMAQSLHLDRDTGINGAYFFFLGVPSLIYLAVAFRLSDRFPALVKAHYTVRENPAPERPVSSITEIEDA